MTTISFSADQVKYILDHSTDDEHLIVIGLIVVEKLQAAKAVQERQDAIPRKHCIECGHVLATGHYFPCSRCPAERLFDTAKPDS